MSVIRTRLLALAVVFATPAVFAADKADVENGKTLFEQRCGICHATSLDDNKTMGPSMIGLVGRKAATQMDFTMYTEALKTYGVTWSAKTLDTFLTSPFTVVPGTTMPMMLADTKERGDVIAYLATLKPAK